MNVLLPPQMKNKIKDQNDLLEVPLQWHLYNPFLLCNNTVLLLKNEAKQENLKNCVVATFPLQQ